MPEPAYPIYLVDQEGLVFCCPNAGTWQGYIEYTDVVTEELVGWDSEGRELDISWAYAGAEICVAERTKTGHSEIINKIHHALMSTHKGRRVSK